ncbi:YcaO-like family protein [Mycobacterium angelicum]|nr:YcaO-like family protein [Mycobacterium angelicum]MCV7200068.1 YcaO-like family protein [Mycobacterium angelicum]
MLSGPDWSHWPNRDLGAANPATIDYRTGTHRIISPEMTWRAVQPVLDLAGITRVADLTWLDDIGIPTVQAVRPGSMTLSVSQGKGVTHCAAQVSAVMESLENWHAENVSPELWSVRASDLLPGLTYDPALLRRPQDSLYHPAVKLDWMTATTMLTGRRTWAPHQAVVMNLAVKDAWDPPMFSADSTGLASGNSYYEAALHGLYEIMERHSLAAGEPGLTMFQVPLEDIESSSCAELAETIVRSGSQIRITRIDNWNGFYCFAVDLISPMTEVSFSGSGLHHDPNVALSRAITEAAQSRLTAISGAREDLPPLIYHRFAKLHTYAPLCPTRWQLPQAWPISWDVPTQDSLLDLLSSAATAVATETGTEPIAAACNFADACIPVVKVIAPGLLASVLPPLREPQDGRA